MKTRSAVYGLLQWMAALFVCLTGAQFAHAQNYSVTNLGSINSWLPEKGVNSSGQAVFYDDVGGSYRTFFLNGASSQDIGSLGGSDTFPGFINDAGQVVGYSHTAGNAAYHAFSWTAAGGMVELTLGGSLSNSASGLNASGQVVGTSFTPGNAAQHAFSWTAAGGMVDLGTLGGTYSYATGVNASGQVVGSSYTAGNATYHAFSWTSGGMIDLGTLGGSYSEATGVNDSGQVIGVSSIAGDAEQHAFSWTPAGMVDLGTLGGTYSFPTGINASGQVIGVSSIAGDAEQHAFAWTAAGGMVDLGTLGGTYSYPTGVNDSGQVIGNSYTAGDAAQQAFVWTSAGGMVELALGGSYGNATGVNASGLVVGSSYIAGDSAPHAFAWTQAGGLVDLNAHIPSAPPGMELFYGLAVSSNGSIAAYANTGTVLLGGSSTAPVVGPIAASDPVAVGVQLALSAGFTDADTSDMHSAQWTWGDAGGEPGIVSEAGGSGTASGTHAFAAAGIYKVNLQITDSTGRTAQTSRDVVVYDPSAGFVTGGGWINSPVGAYRADPTLAGRATFSFVSRYHKGAKVPTGNTEFQFRAANLNFHSEKYDWLVVAGARAQYKGIGTINGAGDFKFMLTAIDGDVNGGGGADRFRIKIWHYDLALEADVLDYDNQVDASAEGTPTEGTVIGGGSIVIHKK